MKLLLVACLILPLSCFSQNDSALVLYFELDKAHLTPAAQESLDSMISVQPRFFDKYSFVVNGHCDQSGPGDYNDKLSARRVSTVLRHMRKYRVPAWAVYSNAYGEKMPVNNGETESDRQKSRRVEILIVRNRTTSLKEKLRQSDIPNGFNLVLKNIHFYGGRPVLLPSSEPMLKELLDAMNAMPKLVIEIQGHVCCEPTESDGMNNDSGLRNLSHARAETIRDYLIQNGIANERVLARGLGHSSPIYAYPEQSEEQRVENRRVEIRVVRR